MKKYTKKDNKVFVTESIEKEVDVSSINSRIETLDTAILGLTKQSISIGEQTNTYQIEKDELEKELKEIDKVKEISKVKETK